MNSELSQDSSRSDQKASLQTEAARGAWHSPSLTVMDMRRTMAAAGAYIDFGTGSSF